MTKNDLINGSAVWRAAPAAVLEYLAEFGKTVDDAQHAIDTSRDVYWVVNTRHPAWPRPAPLPPADLPSSLPPDPDARWLAAFRRSYQPVADIAAEIKWLSLLPSGMIVPRSDASTCDCKKHWAELMHATPPTVETPASYTAWLLAARNNIAARLGKPQLTLDEVEIRYPRLLPDRVVVLSLDSRPDRWDAVTASIKTSRVLSRVTVERHRARLPSEMIVPDGWRWLPSMYATGMDHRAIIEQSYAAGDQLIMIFEDDALLQEGFDQAYVLACRSLPADWMGLWLTSDGHRRPPVPVGPGLVRSTCQAMLHAYMLNRRGMRRVYHELVSRPNYIVDGVTEDLHGREPHFYATATNAVRQFGSRLKPDGRRDEFFDKYGEGSAGAASHHGTA